MAASGRREWYPNSWLPFISPGGCPQGLDDPMHGPPKPCSQLKCKGLREWGPGGKFWWDKGGWINPRERKGSYQMKKARSDDRTLGFSDGMSSRAVTDMPNLTAQPPFLLCPPTPNLVLGSANTPHSFIILCLSLWLEYLPHPTSPTKPAEKLLRSSNGLRVPVSFW